MNSHIMLDLETLSTSPNAAILSIGAVEFCPARKALGREFYQLVDLESAVAAGGEISASTVLWWMGRDEAARGEFAKGGVPLATALQAFRHFVAGLPGTPVIWANAPSFDCVILRQAYARSAIVAPWSYRDERCYRTLSALYPEVTTERAWHHALGDATAQARHLMEILDASGLVEAV